MQKPELDLNDLLRYGFAGAVFILVTFFAFLNPRQLFMNNNCASGALTAASTAVALTIGCVIYSLHRAGPYPLFYLVVKIIARRKKLMVDLDIQRWKNLSKEKAIQPRLNDWCAQIHFLYCIAWASLLALLMGTTLEWQKTEAYCVFWKLFVLFLVFGFIHHLRGQLWERRVMEEDNKLPD